MRVVIVGGGLLGVTTAHFLRAGGAEVVLVERRDGPGLETSYANGALLTPSLADPWNGPGVGRQLLRSLGREDAAMLLRLRALPSLVGWGLAFLRNASRRRFEAAFLRNVRLAHYSQSVMRELSSEHALEFDHAEPGTLKVFRDADALRDATAVARFLEPAGVTHRVHDRDGLLEREPALRPIGSQLVGGLEFPDDETGDARRFCEALAGVAEKAGVVIRFGEEVRGFERVGRRVRSVRCTSGEALAADAFVLAAGSYSAPLARPLGLRLPVRPAKGYSLTVPTAGWQDGAPRFPVIDDALHAAVTPLAGVLRVAGTAEFTGFDLSLSPARIANLRGLLRAVYPEFERRLAPDAVRAWCGLRPMTSDGVPLLGDSPLENLYLNTGHGHLGWTLACGSGRLVADRVIGRRPALALDDYAYPRRR